MIFGNKHEYMLQYLYEGLLHIVDNNWYRYCRLFFNNRI
jgi:hypothetical protein